MEKLRQFILKRDWKQLFAFCAILWLGLNFFQALFTEMLSDEAYYSLYGQRLAWGYFDHPPMVALMTHVSAMFFGGNLSVRLVTVLMQFFTLLLVWKLIDEKEITTRKIALFFSLAFSMVMFQAYGFVTTPDVPLLFFSVLFLLFYKKFLQNESWINTLMLAVSMSGMIYSKYHAGLIIGLVILSNLKLLTRYKFWIAGALALISFMPHVCWQISMDFPSLQYHLNDRSNPFEWKYWLEYIPNQLVVFNPFVFGAMVYIFIKYRAKDLFEKALYFITIGFVAFFWIMSLRGHVEPHWTVICTVPMIVLMYNRSLQDAKLLRFVKRWVVPSIILIFVIRIVFVTDWLPNYMHFHGKATESKDIETIAGDLPVVFVGSYQSPSNYRFFTGKQSSTLSYMDQRSTQFDIWQDELKWQGKSVFMCYQWTDKAKEYTVNGKTFYGFFAKNFQTVSRVKIDYEIEQKSIHAGDTLTIDFIISNPTNIDINFKHEEFPVSWNAVYMWSDRVADRIFCPCNLVQPINWLRAKSAVKGSLKTVVPDVPESGNHFTLTLFNTVYMAKNAKFIQLEVEKR